MKYGIPRPTAVRDFDIAPPAVGQTPPAFPSRIPSVEVTLGEECDAE